MSNNNTQLPVEVAEEIEAAASDKFSKMAENAEDEKDNAYAQGFAEGWHEGATEYATKMHQVQQENEKLKAMATGWRPLLEKVIHRHEGGLLPDRILYLEIKKFLYGE